MTLPTPYPAELVGVARKVVWYDSPENALADLTMLLTQLMVYGSAADVTVVARYVPSEEFRKVLEHAPPGVFTKDPWRDGMNAFRCQCHRCRDADSRTVQWVRKPGNFLGARCILAIE